MVQQVVPEAGTENEVRVTKGEGVTVHSRTFSASPEGKTSTSELFTQGIFEDALDKVSRPLKGRLAHVPYSSEDFIKEKREEAELEDRPS